MDHNRTTFDLKSSQCITCFCCGTLLPGDHCGIRCKNNHHLCNDGCSKLYIESQLSTGLWPFRCSICSDKLEFNSLLKHMTASQVVAYQTGLREGTEQSETLLVCQNVHCTKIYAEKCKKVTNSRLLMLCTECYHLTCGVCLQSFHATSHSIDFHNTHCRELIQIKCEFENAIANGTSFRCPNCGYGGRKEYGCNNISCIRCGTNWCYICQTAQRSSHECAYHGICDNHSVTYLHRSRTLHLLHDVYIKYGSVKFKLLWDSFQSIRAHGYAYDEIVNPPKLFWLPVVLPSLLILFFLFMYFLSFA
jgi:hypothetical protein